MPHPCPSFGCLGELGFQTNVAYRLVGLLIFTMSPFQICPHFYAFTLLNFHLFKLKLSHIFDTFLNTFQSCLFSCFLSFKTGLRHRWTANTQSFIRIGLDGLDLSRNTLNTKSYFVNHFHLTIVSVCWAIRMPTII